MRKLQNIAVLPGDGIGPEVVAQAIKVLDAIAERFGHIFEYSYGLIGSTAIDKLGNPFPQETLEICKQADAILLGSIGERKFDKTPNELIRPEKALLSLRKELGLFANIRPIKVYKELKGLSVIKQELLENVDLVIFREFTGGIYYGEKIREKDFASDACSYHRFEIERIARLAFAAAVKRRKKLTLVDKANVLESSRLWRDVVIKMAEDFPEVEVEYMYVDNASMQIILQPSRFDVILCSNIFGDILSEEASLLVGSLGLLPSSSKGEKHYLYSPVHGSYPEQAGKDIANPLAIILSVEMMLRDAGLTLEADTIIRAVDFCLEKKILTEDLNPDVNYSCSQMGEIIQSLITDGPESLKTKSLREASSTIV